IQNTMVIIYVGPTAPESRHSRAVRTAKFNPADYGLQTSGIREVHRIVVSVSVAVERLLISEAIAVIGWVRLIEARPPAVITTEHRLIRLIYVAFVVVELVRLKGIITAPVSIASPRIEFNGAHHRSGTICYSLALHQRILVHPVDSTRLLCSYQLSAEVNIATLECSVAVNLSNDLATQNATAQVIGPNIVVTLLPS